MRRVSIQRETLEIGFLFALGFATAALGVLLIDEVPYISFPFNLNIFFWAVGFMTLGLMPAVAYVSNNRRPTVVSIGLFAFGGSVVILAPVIDAVEPIIYWDGISPLLFVIVLLATIPATQYGKRIKEILLMLGVMSILCIYLFIGAYVIIAFIRAGDALVFVPFIGTSFIVLAVVATLLNEYRRIGLRRLDL